MAVTYTEFPESKLVELRVDGKVTTADFDEIAPKLEQFIAEHGNVKILELIPALEGVDLDLIWKGLVFNQRNLKHISHCAVVSDMGWYTPIAKVADAVLDLELRTYSLEEQDDARQWLLEA